MRSQNLVRTTQQNRQLILCAYRYQFNPHLTRDETTTNILVKSLTVFPSPDFSLCLSLLPPYVLQDSKASGGASSGTLAEAVQHLDVLHNQLNNAQYADFWSTMDSSDLYADLTADVVGFEDTMRIRIAVVVSQCMQEVGRRHLEQWLNVQGEKFEHFVKDVCGWKIEGETVKVPLNKENEARSVVQRETVKFDQFSRLVKRAYEQPA
jgi:translation initiation factor 3 subunit K